MVEKESTLGQEGKLAADFDALKRDLGQLREDVTSLTRTLLDEGKLRTASAREKLGSEAQKRWSQVGSGVDKMREVGKTGADKLEEQVKEHPLASVGIAFGIGVIIGQLLRR